MVRTRVGDIYALLFGWPWLVKLHLGVSYLCARALGLHNYSSARITGERIAIRMGVGGKSNPVVFDVGANEGQWLADVLACCPSACIHAFEPQASLARQVARKHSGVSVNNLALADVAGTLELCDYAAHKGSQHATLLKGVIDGIHHGKARYIQVPVGTVDEYCMQRGIDRIDLLKIDVEGFEFKVLQGARRMLEEQRVDVIQFEFNEMNVVSRAFLNDFASCLQASHQLYRLLPHGLLPLRIGGHWNNEQFVFQNIIALRKR
jgi:FkbM family methyltransferase